MDIVLSKIGVKRVYFRFLMYIQVLFFLKKYYIVIGYIQNGSFNSSFLQTWILEVFSST
jgi:hypothetical protein